MYRFGALAACARDGWLLLAGHAQAATTPEVASLHRRASTSEVALGQAHANLGGCRSGMAVQPPRLPERNGYATSEVASEHALQPRRLPGRNGYATSTVACANGNATSEVTMDRRPRNLKSKLFALTSTYCSTRRRQASPPDPPGFN